MSFTLFFLCYICYIFSIIMNSQLSMNSKWVNELQLFILMLKLPNFWPVGKKNQII